MTFIFALQCGIAYSSIGILHGGNARPPPVGAAGIQFHYPGSARRSARSDVSAFPDNYALPAPSHPAGPSGFLFLKFVQLLLIVFSLGRRHRPGRFSVARDFFLQCRDLFIGACLPARYPASDSHGPLRRITDSIPCSFNPAQIVVYVPPSAYSFLPNTRTWQFSRHQPLFPARPSTLICSSWVAVRKCSVLSSSFAAFNRIIPQAFKLADGFIH
ncbi:Uncharacterised protein [Salmonella enterica subsp. enterica]|uniref:Uncharacterized protein n=1 Tax=Salmonella enterica I TaxID=59201 RepID=A0A447N627_SALET|nr:Uncharacterised protein [Salmonella enterica subsp. enterica]